MLNHQNYTNGNNLNPILPLNTENLSNAKLTEDKYEVYVNNNFVGRKTLKNQGESLSDIDDFLQAQGISNFSSSIDGDHYNINADDYKQVTNALSVYFNNR